MKYMRERSESNRSSSSSQNDTSVNGGGNLRAGGGGNFKSGKSNRSGEIFRGAFTGQNDKDNENVKNSLPVEVTNQNDTKASDNKIDNRAKRAEEAMQRVLDNYTRSSKSNSESKSDEVKDTRATATTEEKVPTKGSKSGLSSGIREWLNPSQNESKASPSEDKYASEKSGNTAEDNSDRNSTSAQKAQNFKNASSNERETNWTRPDEGSGGFSAFSSQMSQRFRKTQAPKSRHNNASKRDIFELKSRAKGNQSQKPPPARPAEFGRIFDEASKIVSSTQILEVESDLKAMQAENEENMSSILRDDSDISDSEDMEPIVYYPPKKIRSGKAFS